MIKILLNKLSIIFHKTTLLENKGGLLNNNYYSTKTRRKPDPKSKEIKSRTKSYRGFKGFPKKSKRRQKDVDKGDFKLSDLNYLDLFYSCIDQLINQSIHKEKFVFGVNKELLTGKLLAQTVFTVYDNLIKHHGVKSGSKIWKNYRSYTLRQARGQEIIPFYVATQTGRKDKVISKFQILRPLIRASKLGCEKSYQILNTLLYSTRVDERLPDSRKYSLEDVLYKFKCDPKSISLFRDWFKRKVDMGDFRLPEMEVGKLAFEVALTSGSPTGGLNIESLEEQAYHLRNSKLWNSFVNLSNLFGDETFPKWIDGIAEEYSKGGLNTSLDESSKTGELNTPLIKPVRRITRVSDSDVKDRVIAIMDAYSQILGERVQKHLYSFMRSNLNNYTDVFDHTKGARIVLGLDDTIDFISPGDQYVFKCIDFDAWTWKFSREPQIIVLEELFNKAIGDNFNSLFLKCEWSCDEAKTGFKTVIAQSGQAMGGKASFALATVTSICILLAASDGIFDEFLDPEIISNLKEIGKYQKSSVAKFRETGDDIVLYDYYGRLESSMKLFGNTINISKSVYASEYPSGDITGFTEYLSRTSINNKECSRVSLKLCRLAAKHYANVPLFLSHCLERNLSFDSSVFENIWSKEKDGVLKHKCDKTGRKWIDCLRAILTLSNPSKLPSDYITSNGYIDVTFSEQFIRTFPLRTCLILLDESLAKMSRTASDLKSQVELLRFLTLNQQERPLFLEERKISPLDMYWAEYLERTNFIILNIKKFIYEHLPPDLKPKRLMPSPYILPKFMTSENIEKVLLSLTLEETSEQLQSIINLMLKDARSVDGSYPKFSNRSKHFKNLSSLALRTLNASSNTILMGLEEHIKTLDSSSILCNSVDTKEVTNPPPS